ncbi:hypothetical protein PGB90_008205 [Kerria lacca]
MSNESLKTSLENGILTLTMNLPSNKNAINPEQMQKITNILNEAANNEAVDFVILTGSGHFYSSGFDINPTKNNENLDPIKIGREFIASFIDFPKLLIALVNGPAVGIAVTTLGLCDLVFCSTESYFWVPFTLRGLSAEGCSSYIFPRIIGYMRANEVLQFGRKFTASEAKEWGFVSDTFKPEELSSVLIKIREMRDSLSKKTRIANLIFDKTLYSNNVLQYVVKTDLIEWPTSIEINKKLMRMWNKKILHEVNTVEWEYLENRLISQDFQERMLTFLKNKERQTKLWWKYGIQ